MTPIHDLICQASIVHNYDNNVIQQKKKKNYDNNVGVKVLWVSDCYYNIYYKRLINKVRTLTNL